MKAHFLAQRGLAVEDAADLTAIVAADATRARRIDLRVFDPGRAREVLRVLGDRRLHAKLVVSRLGGIAGSANYSRAPLRQRRVRRRLRRGRGGWLGAGGRERQTGSGGADLGGERRLEREILEALLRPVSPEGAVARLLHKQTSFRPWRMEHQADVAGSAPYAHHADLVYEASHIVYEHGFAFVESATGSDKTDIGKHLGWTLARTFEAAVALRAEPPQRAPGELRPGALGDGARRHRPGAAPLRARRAPPGRPYRTAPSRSLCRRGLRERPDAEMRPAAGPPGAAERVDEAEGDTQTIIEGVAAYLREPRRLRENNYHDLLSEIRGWIDAERYAWIASLEIAGFWGAELAIFEGAEAFSLLHLRSDDGQGAARGTFAPPRLLKIAASGEVERNQIACARVLRQAYRETLEQGLAGLAPDPAGITRALEALSDRFDDLRDWDPVMRSLSVFLGRGQGTGVPGEAGFDATTEVAQEPCLV